MATARHVVDFPRDETISWIIQQFDEHGEVVREQRFATSEDKSVARGVPYRTHKTLDVALTLVPSQGNDGGAFASEGELPVPMTGYMQGAGTGSLVGWAGFPAVIEHVLGFPQLCYFEGVVSSMVNREDKRVYVVDGHAAEGVSGGPVWDWSDQRQRYEVIGIVSEYLGLGASMPGFCFFEPINPLLYYLNDWRQEEAEKNRDELLFIPG